MFDLFPTSSVDASILTSVMVGFLVIWAFQEMFGWNFTGLVVPGYLATVFLIQPGTGIVVVVEAVVCWAAFLAISGPMPTWWPWTPLFGRDRFFAFLLLSVLIRVLLEAGGFAVLTESLGVRVDEDLHSMGLVIVPLAANALWRSGPSSAAVRFAVPVALTWLLLEGVLLRYTNLSLSSFELAYEDLARDFVSSPHAYVLLLLGAWLGSQANHRWGWDFGGIIVPGLLALVWLEPTRLLATLAEAVVIAGGVRLAVRLPLLRTANLAGGRPLALAFLLGYLLKFVLAWTFVGTWAGFGVRDLFGFGYLLSSLLALRILKHNDVFRSLLPALVTSFVAFLLGSVVVGLLSVVLPGEAPLSVADGPPAVDQREHVLTAAFADAGAVPEGVAAAVSRAGVSILTGGEGFGAVWVRAAGIPLAVVGDVGPDGVGSATLALADALSARVVVLCAVRESTACRGAVEQIARTLPVLHVTLGEQSRLLTDATSIGVLDMGGLGGLIGPFTVASADAATVLELAPPARARAAATLLGPAPVGVLDAAVAGPPPDPSGIGPDAGHLRRFLTELARPWLAWRSGGAEAADELALAAGTARALGLELAWSGDSSTLLGPGWAARLTRSEGTTVIYVPEGARAPRTVNVASALRVAIGAPVQVTDASSASTTNEYPTVLVIAALEALGEAASAITVRSVPRAIDPGADIVLSTGAPLPASAALPERVQVLRALLEGAGFSVGLQDGAAQRMGLTDSGNPVPRALEASTGRRDHVVLFATAPAIDQFSTPADPVEFLAAGDP